MKRLILLVLTVLLGCGNPGPYNQDVKMRNLPRLVSADNFYIIECEHQGKKYKILYYYAGDNSSMTTLEVK